MKVLDIYKDKTTMQTFDDAKQERPLAHKFAYNEARCKELNDQGAGIFWTINPQEDPNDRGIKTTYELRCVGLDCDVTKESDEKKSIERLPEEKVQELKTELFTKLVSLPVIPSGIIETKNGLQPYWVFINPRPITKENRDKANILYQDYIRGIAKATGIKSEGDNIQRVLRMPGFYHKKSEPAFMVRDIFEEGVACDWNDFKTAYPFVVREGSKPKKPYSPASGSTRLEDVPVQEALEKLSGMGIVNHEQYTFRPNSNGTIQILIDGKASGQWIDPEQNTIGGSGEGQGNPTIIQWVAWYYKAKGSSNELAHAKAYQSLYLLLLPDVPEEQWGIPKKKPKTTQSHGAVTIADIDPTYTAQMLTDPDFAKGIPTKYKIFDEITKGLRKQFVYGVVAASGQGKSVLAVNILYNIAKQGYAVGYLDLENGPIMGEKRLLQIHSGWNGNQIASLEKQDTKAIIEVLKEMESEVKFYRLYDLEASKAERQHMKAIEIIAHLVKEKGVRVVCIDNVNCFIPDKRNENEYKSELYVEFSKLAIDLDISIIVIHHATDKLQKKKGYTKQDIESEAQKEFTLPYLSSALGTSTFIEKINVGMTFTYEEATREIWCSIEKNRDGSSGKKFPLIFNANNLRIVNYFGDEINPGKDFIKDKLQFKITPNDNGFDREVIETEAGSESSEGLTGSNEVESLL